MSRLTLLVAAVALASAARPATADPDAPRPSPADPDALRLSPLGDANAAPPPPNTSAVTPPARAPLPVVVREAPGGYSRNWPLSISATLLLGVEPRGQSNGLQPFAFGIGGEFLWKARVGGFVSLLSSEGTLVLVTQVVNGSKAPSLPDRISVPFGVAARPLAALFELRDGYLARLAAGLGLQLGVAVENLRTSDDSATVAGLHLGVSLDVPLWGGPIQGGVGLRVMGRGVIAPAVNLSQNSVSEPIATGQFYAGICYWP